MDFWQGFILITGVHLLAAMSPVRFCFRFPANARARPPHRAADQHRHRLGLGRAYCLFGVGHGGADCIVCVADDGGKNHRRRLFDLFGDSRFTRPPARCRRLVRRAACTASRVCRFVERLFVQCVEPQSPRVFRVAVYGGAVARNARVAVGGLRRVDDAAATGVVCGGGLAAVGAAHQPPFPNGGTLD